MRSFIAAVALAVIPGVASSATMQWTFEGTIRSIDDPLGIYSGQGLSPGTKFQTIIAFEIDPNYGNNYYQEYGPFGGIFWPDFLRLSFDPEIGEVVDEGYVALTEAGVEGDVFVAVRSGGPIYRGEQLPFMFYLGAPTNLPNGMSLKDEFFAELSNPAPLQDNFLAFSSWGSDLDTFLDIRFHSLKSVRIDEPEVPPVPIPASALLLTSGLAFATAFRRRRR